MAGKVPDVPAINDVSGRALTPADALFGTSTFLTGDRRRSALRPRRERTFPLPSAYLANGVARLETDGRTDRTPRLAPVDPDR